MDISILTGGQPTPKFKAAARKVHPNDDPEPRFAHKAAERFNAMPMVFTTKLVREMFNLDHEAAHRQVKVWRAYGWLDPIGNQSGIGEVRRQYQKRRERIDMRPRRVVSNAAAVARNKELLEQRLHDMLAALPRQFVRKDVEEVTTFSKSGANARLRRCQRMGLIRMVEARRVGSVIEYVWEKVK